MTFKESFKNYINENVVKHFENKIGIPLLFAQAGQLRMLYGIPKEDYERANAIEHPYVSAMLQLKYGQNAPNLAKALGHSLDLIKQAYDRTDGTGLIQSFDDPRIPSKATGWPGTFPLPGTRGAPNWRGPDSG